MLFNSYEFLIFLSLVFFLYWFAFQKDLKVQNAFILLAVMFFMDGGIGGFWD